MVFESLLQPRGGPRGTHVPAEPVKGCQRGSYTRHSNAFACLCTWPVLNLEQMTCQPDPVHPCLDPGESRHVKFTHQCCNILSIDGLNTTGPKNAGLGRPWKQVETLRLIDSRSENILRMFDCVRGHCNSSRS